MMNTQSDEQKSVSDVTRGAIVTQTQGTPTPTTASTEAPLSTSSTVNSTSTTANYKVTIESPNNSPTADEDGTINTAYAHLQEPITQGSPSKWDEIEELEQLLSAKTTSSVKEPASRQESNTYDSADVNEQIFKRRDDLGEDDDDDEVGKTLKSSSFNAQLDQYNLKHNQIYTSGNTSNAMGVADGVTGKRQSKKPNRFSPNSTEKKNSSTKEGRAAREPSDPEDDDPSSSYDESSEDSESESSVDKQEEIQTDTPSPKKKRRAAAGKNRKKTARTSHWAKFPARTSQRAKVKKLKANTLTVLRILSSAGYIPTSKITNTWLNVTAIPSVTLGKRIQRICWVLFWVVMRKSFALWQMFAQQRNFIISQKTLSVQLIR